jgi:hypothetical protein
VGFGFAGDDYVPSVDPAAWELLDLSDANLREIVDEMDHTLRDAGDFLIGNESD